MDFFSSPALGLSYGLFGLPVRANGRPLGSFWPYPIALIYLGAHRRRRRDAPTAKSYFSARPGDSSRVVGIRRRRSNLGPALLVSRRNHFVKNPESEIKLQFS
jgi:hypothetical protein